MRVEPDPAFVEDVRRGLTGEPKHVPPVWFYDAEGSRLFEAITDTPEYYPTRTEAAILEEHARAIIDAVPDLDAVVELGAGSGRKTRIVLRAACARWGRARYFPIDVSETALNLCRDDLQQRLPDVDVHPIHARNRAGVTEVPRRGHHLVLFLGSSIGNLERDEQVIFLRDLANGLEPGDVFLLGTDMVKDASVLRAAYDDAAGVTAAFNKNVLARMNRELGADFDPDGFQHVARWNPDEARMEMFLESELDQVVDVPAIGTKVVFGRGERLHTENSHKFTPAMVEALAEGAGFEVVESFYDDRRWFGLHLMRRP